MRRQNSITGSPLLSGLQPSPMFSSLQGDQDVIANFIFWTSNNGYYELGLGGNLSTSIVRGGISEVNYSGGSPASWDVAWVGFSIDGGVPLDMNIVGTVTGFFTPPFGFSGIFLSGGNDVIYGTMAYHEVVFYNSDGRHPKQTVLKPAYFTEFMNGEVGRFFRVFGNFVTVFWIGKQPAELPSVNFKPTDYGLVQAPTQFGTAQP